MPFSVEAHSRSQALCPEFCNRIFHGRGQVRAFMLHTPILSGHHLRNRQEKATDICPFLRFRFLAEAAVADRYTYLNAMLPLLPLLMLDDRNPPTLQTIVVVSFVRIEGLQTLFAALDSIWSAVASK